MAVFRTRAFAKINLGLHITGARGDGFHDIRTIFQTIDLHDRLTFQPRRGPFEIRCNVPGVPVDCRNLVWKAAEQIWAAAGRTGAPHGAVVTIDKRIPMQAGLGGGSTDAAAALLGLQRVWNVALAPAELHQAAAALGSDVPFFLVGGTALGLGRGEEVYPLENLPRLWVVLVTPPFGVATKNAYAWWDESEKRVPLLPDRAENGTRPPLPRAFPAWVQTVSLENHFERPVFQKHPTLAALKAELERAGAAPAAMSGSGSTVFGVFSSVAAADRARRAIAREKFETRVARFQPRTRT